VIKLAANKRKETILQMLARAKQGKTSKERGKRYLEAMNYMINEMKK